MNNKIKNTNEPGEQPKAESENSGSRKPEYFGAVEYFNPKTGEVIREEYYPDGETTTTRVGRIQRSDK